MLAAQQRWQNARGETDCITEDYLYTIREQEKNFKGEFFERDCSWTGIHVGRKRFFRYLDEGWAYQKDSLLASLRVTRIMMKKRPFIVVIYSEGPGCKRVMLY